MLLLRFVTKANETIAFRETGFVEDDLEEERENWSWPLLATTVKDEALP